MGQSLRNLNEERRAEYHKNSQDEDFLLELNRALQSRELALYGDYNIEHPFIFVFGLPRSGTTLITQLIAYSLDVGYINNLIARFWLAPVHGTRLSKNILGNLKGTSFQSDYARTSELADIHEFGYFWRFWLQKETFADIIHVKEREKSIDWSGLKKALSNVQHEFQKPMVFKNIFGSYHLQKLSDELGKVLYVYIERDPLDVAISILNARKKYYSDLNRWWSYTPVEYDRIKDLDYWEQIAGQIYFLSRYYERVIGESPGIHVIHVAYRELCAHPGKLLGLIQRRCEDILQYNLDIINEPPEEFPCNVYRNHDEEKDKFKRLLQKFELEND
jgi:hypothetical protein